MLSTPLICCSIGVATDCSTVSASAPGYVAFTWISGGAISGNCAVGSRNIEITPMITMRMAITMATIGLLMKKFAMVLLPFGLGAVLGRGLHNSHRVSFANFLLALDDH